MKSAHKWEQLKVFCLFVLATTSIAIAAATTVAAKLTLLFRCRRQWMFSLFFIFLLYKRNNKDSSEIYTEIVVSWR